MQCLQDSDEDFPAASYGATKWAEHSKAVRFTCLSLLAAPKPLQEGDLARQAAANAHAQLQGHERKIELLQKELEDTSLARKEAQKRACDLEAERGRVKKAGSRPELLRAWFSRWLRALGGRKRV